MLDIGPLHFDGWGINDETGQRLATLPRPANYPESPAARAYYDGLGHLLASAPALREALADILGCIVLDGNGETYHLEGFVREAIETAQALLNGKPAPTDPAPDYRCRACGAPITAAQADDNSGLCSGPHPEQE